MKLSRYVRLILGFIPIKLSEEWNSTKFVDPEATDNLNEIVSLLVKKLVCPRLSKSQVTIPELTDVKVVRDNSELEQLGDEEWVIKLSSKESHAKAEIVIEDCEIKLESISNSKSIEIGVAVGMK